ncbi:helix-turn-helix domain-containing protein [Listeria monocytogenes]
MPEVLTVKEVAEILKTNVTYVYKLRDAGLITCLKLGQWKVTRKELERFLEDNKNMDLTDPFNPKELNHARG